VVLRPVRVTPCSITAGSDTDVDCHMILPAIRNAANCDETRDELLLWLRQLRKSLRYLMSNLDDFDPSRHLLSYAHVQLVDRYTLHLLHNFVSQVVSYAMLLTISLVIVVLRSCENSAVGHSSV